MPEYITKQQAIKALEDALWDSDTPEDIEFYFESQLKKIEPAEVVVTNGRWEFYGEDGHGFGLWKCTNCGSVTGEKYAEAYCPQCGARMDGDEQ